jgi:hypothetical protein
METTDQMAMREQYIMYGIAPVDFVDAMRMLGSAIVSRAMTAAGTPFVTLPHDMVASTHAASGLVRLAMQPPRCVSTRTMPTCFDPIRQHWILTRC